MPVKKSSRRRNKADQFIAVVLKLAKNGKVTLVATGDPTGEMTKVVPKEGDRKTDGILKRLLKYLSIVAFTGEIIRIIQSIKGKQQLIGVSRAGCVGSSLSLFGLCLQHNEPVPDEGEELREVETDEANRLKARTNPWLTYFNTHQREIISDLNIAWKEHVYDKKRIIDHIEQVGAWIITDDISFDRNKTYLFGPEEFFTTEHLEILLILHKHLMLAGINIKEKKIREGLRKSILHNYIHQEIARDKFEDWQRKYDLTLITLAAVDHTILAIRFGDERKKD